MGKGSLTPQAPGRPEMRFGLRPGMFLAEEIKQLQAILRLGVLLANAFRDLTPLQQLVGVVPPVLR